MGVIEAFAWTGLTVTGLFWVWVFATLAWRDRPPVMRDPKTGRYRSARMTKQRRGR